MKADCKKCKWGNPTQVPGAYITVTYCSSSDLYPNACWDNHGDCKMFKEKMGSKLVRFKEWLESMTPVLVIIEILGALLMCASCGA